MNDRTETFIIQSYPPAAEIKRGPPTMIWPEHPPLPGEDYVQYGARIGVILAHQRLQEMDAAMRQRESVAASRQWCSPRTLALGVAALFLALVGFAIFAIGNF